MGQRDTTRRRFTLSDTAVLVASTGVGLWLARSYLFNEQSVFSTIRVCALGGAGPRPRGWC